MDEDVKWNLPSTYAELYITKSSKPNMLFVRWIRGVEAKVKNKYGCGLLDLSDEDYIGYFEMLYTQDMMVKVIAESNKF